MFVNLEYNLASRVKNQLIDNYSHDIGNILQVMYGGLSVLTMDKDDNGKIELGGKKIQLLTRNLDQASDLIKKIRKL
ncbi:MAG: hypothetical protein ACW981_19410 [Candidatus Hodarchaeales archaeon]